MNQDFYSYAYEKKLDLNSWYAVIPFQVLSNPSISETSKVVYGIISSLVKGQGYCWASNAYIGSILSKSLSTISSCVSELQTIEAVRVELDIKDGNTRKIFLTHLYTKTGRGMGENSQTLPTKTNTYNNNTLIQIDNKNIYSDIEKVFSSFKEKILPNTRLMDQGKDKIKTRLKKFSVEQLLEAIDKFSKNTWRMERNAHLGVAWFFKSDEQMQTFLSLKQEKQSASITFN